MVPLQISSTLQHTRRTTTTVQQLATHIKTSTAHGQHQNIHRSWSTSKHPPLTVKAHAHGWRLLCHQEMCLVARLESVKLVFICVLSPMHLLSSLTVSFFKPTKCLWRSLTRNAKLPLCPRPRSSTSSLLPVTDRENSFRVSCLFPDRGNSRRVP
jgi:hypothetical protein